MRFAAALGVLLVAPGASAQIAQRVRRPPPLEVTEPECELFTGQGEGNSDAFVELRFCPQPDGRVEGVHQWSSTQSGWSQRAFVGRWDGDHFTGHETRFIERRPQPGWRFCLLDTYDLRLEGDRLRGPFRSEECRDVGAFDLTRVGPAPPPIQHSAPPPVRQAERDARESSGALCAVRGGARDARWAWLVALAWLVRCRRCAASAPSRRAAPAR